jgi:DNA polymerase-1
MEGLFGELESEECLSCKRYIKAEDDYRYMEGEGNCAKGIFIVLPPASHEVFSQMDQFEQILWDHGIDLEKDCFYTFSTQCISSAKTTDTTIKKCSHRVLKEIRKVSPKYIWMVGTEAVTSVCSQYSSLATTSCFKINGETIPLVDYDAWGFVSLNFMDVFSKKSENIKSEFMRDVAKFADLIQGTKPLYRFNPFEDIKPITDFEEICDTLENILENITVDTLISFDYETTSIKPHKEDSKITCVSLCVDAYTYVFPLRYQDWFTEEEIYEIENLLNELLVNETCFLVSHNSIFEWSWTYFKLGVRPKINYCTMIGAHLLDPRKGTTSLKHQAFMKFGVYGYEDYSKKFITSEVGSCYSLNKMDHMPLQEQLLYCGVDSRIGYFLFLWQEEHTPEKMTHLFDVYMEGAEWFAEMSAYGFPISEEYYEEQKNILYRENDKIIDALDETEEAELWWEEKGEEINWDSAEQLGELFYTLLEYAPEKKTATGKGSTDEEALKKLDHPVIDQLIEYRKNKKLADTYIAQFKREVCEDKVHASFGLNVSLSGRPTCNNPNLLNIPKRNKKQKKIIRMGMRPSKGRRLAEIDFSGIEVSTSACYHKDTNFIRYLQDPSSDMHRDGACDLWKLTPEQVHKDIRQEAKSNWTFPQFYGDWYKSCAPKLWKECLDMETTEGILLRDHVKDVGLSDFKDFEEHLKDMEQVMWKKRFPEYDAWKTEINNKYIKEGEIFAFTGFRYKGLLDKKQTTNVPIQGSAFFILMWCALQIRKLIAKRKYKTKIICQVYDSMVYDLVPEEADELMWEVKRICEEDSLKQFDWITTAFKIDMDLGAVDGDFNSMEEYKFDENKKLILKG